MSSLCIEDHDAVCRAFAIIEANSYQSKEFGVVFDMDETIIRQNPANLIDVIPHEIGATLYRKACKAGYNVAVVSSRPLCKIGIELILRQLHNIENTYYPQVYLLPDQYRQNMSLSTFKTISCHNFARNNNIKILLNVGDQISDLFPDEEHEKYEVMLDNNKVYYFDTSRLSSNLLPMNLLKLPNSYKLK